jgi:hypothetical protein
LAAVGLTVGLVLTLAEGAAVTVTAQELFDAYGKDVVAADTNYTGRLVELSNVSAKVHKDSRGRYYLVAAENVRLVLRADQGARMMSMREYERHMQAAAFNAQYLPGVILYLDPKELEKFSGLGDKTVTIRGKCKGMTDDKSTQPSYFVTLESVRLRVIDGE